MLSNYYFRLPLRHQCVRGRTSDWSLFGFRFNFIRLIGTLFGILPDLLFKFRQAHALLPVLPTDHTAALGLKADDFVQDIVRWRFFAAQHKPVGFGNMGNEEGHGTIAVLATGLGVSRKCIG